MRFLPSSRRHIATVALLFLAFLCDYTAAAADKSGVGPNSISLPKGPGAIEGLGESFQPTLNTGTAKYGVSLKVPPGTAGQTPALGLSYEGGAGNGPLGFGWQLSVGSIQRRSDKGVPTYGENVGFDRADIFINDMKEELVPLTNGYWFCKNEGAFIRYQRVADYWVGTLPDGTRMEYGKTSEGRIDDAANPNRIFSWLLQRETDTHGNAIDYTYRSFASTNNTNQKYLSGISYGPGAPPWANFHFVTFTYEERPDWFEDCRSGFVVRTGKRLKEIVIGTQGPVLTNHLAGDFNGDGQTDYLDRKYVLGYLNSAGTNSWWSLLAKVLPVGADGTSTLPPSTFGYNVCNPPEMLSAAGRTIDGANEPPIVMDSPSVDLVDLNGDGLPDILRTDPGGGSHLAYVNLGETTNANGRSILWQAPTPVKSEDERALLFDLQSTAPIAHLADMDGDGLADLAVTALDGNVLYFANRGTLAWGARQDFSVQDSAPPSPFGSPNVRTADLDFDKRIDIIQSISTGNGVDYRIWFNLGDRSYSRSITVPQISGAMFSEAGVQIVDFNGDRIADIAQLQPTVLIVTAGLGYGRFADAIPVGLPDLVLTDEQVTKAKLTDITGDGLADLVIERTGPGELWYWINLGNYTFSTRKTITGLPTGIGVGAAVRWADLNGNGSTDLIYADSTSSPRLRTIDLGDLLNCGGTPNILTAISNGIGRVTLIGYASSTQFQLLDAAGGKPWLDLMPMPVQVVASVTNLDSLGHQYLTQFRYHNGYYDPGQKQFRGFASAEVIEVGDPTAPTLVTRSFFDTGRIYEPMKGKLLALSIEQEDGAVFSTETNLWTMPPVTLYTGTNGTNVVYAHPMGHVKLISELGQGIPRQLESEVAYDDYGNQTTNADYGIVENGDRSAWNDERITTMEYAINTDKWIVHTPTRTEIRDVSGKAISRSELFYDDETFAGDNFGAVTTGDVTMKREWIDPTIPDVFVTSSRTRFDAYGNPIMVFDPLAELDGGAGNLAKGHIREVTFDPQFHTHPVTETIHIGAGSTPLVFLAVYEAGFGTVTSSADFNSNRTAYRYDPFARLTAILKPGDIAEFPTCEYDYALAVPVGNGGLVNYVETRELDKAPGTDGLSKRDHYLIRREFCDGLGRKLISKEEAEPAPGSTTPRVVVQSAVEFNTRQYVARVLNPFFSTQSGSSLDGRLDYEDISAPSWRGVFEDNGQLVELSLDQAKWHLTSYDATLRAVRNINPDDTFSLTAYEPLLTKSYDENDSDPASPHHDTPIVRYHDGLGRLVRVDEVTRLSDEGNTVGEVGVWTTRYAYDVNDQVVTLTDSQDNLKALQYDGLERQVSVDDPDRGRTRFVYDAASNPIETIDAKGQRITCTYDGGNRLLTEDYHDEDRPFSAGFAYDPSQPVSRSNRPDVAYFYDSPVPNVEMGDGTKATAENTRGTMAYVWDLSGEEHSSRDARGRLAYAVKRVRDPGQGQLVSYRTGFHYDSLDHPLSVLYPDNDAVSYEYNERGLLSRVAGGLMGTILSNRVFSPSASLLEVIYGNGVVTTHAHDSRLRLTSLFTRVSSTGTELVHLSYDFDSASNIRSITDLRPGSAIPEGDNRRNSQTFTYDDLYRLTRVQYSFTSPGTRSRNDGGVDYRYDRIGNRLAQNSDIHQLDRGQPMVNLGSMGYGGEAGRWGRHGRAPGAPPGPHALTSASQSTTNDPQARAYPYDANGNMTNLAGLVCTWDFKNRLVAVEDDEMRAEYTYDYADNRISKRVVLKTNSPSALNIRASTVLYVGKHFEVRDHDAPTKFIWKGDTRIACVTGSLSSNVRVQRLRVHSGWNLVSLAVTTTNLLAQLAALPSQPALDTVYRWVPQSRNYSPVRFIETLPAGTILWVNASTNATLSVTGSYVDPTNLPVMTGGGFIASAGLEAWRVLDVLPGAVVAWKPDVYPGPWRTRLNGSLGPQSDLPEFVAPGEALFIDADSATQLEVPEAVMRVRFYHHDHLGSSSFVSDARGAMVEENAFYPFGAPRARFNPKQVATYYTFTQKERDPESGFHYFGARFESGVLGRFLSVDQLALKSSWLENPQSLDPYAYCANSPPGSFDPDGADFWDTAKSFAKGYVGGQIGSLPSRDPFGERPPPIAQQSAQSAEQDAHRAQKMIAQAKAGDYGEALMSAVSLHPAAKLIDPFVSAHEKGRILGGLVGNAAQAVAGVWLGGGFKGPAGGAGGAGKAVGGNTLKLGNTQRLAIPVARGTAPLPRAAAPAGSGTAFETTQAATDEARVARFTKLVQEKGDFIARRFRETEDLRGRAWRAGGDKAEQKIVRSIFDEVDARYGW